MRCREASVGAILQVVGMALTLSTGLWPAVGLLGGLAAGGLSEREGARNGLSAGLMGLAGIGLSVATLTVLGSPVALPSATAVVVGSSLAVGGAGLGGAVATRLRRRRTATPTATGEGI